MKRNALEVSQIIKKAAAKRRSDSNEQDLAQRKAVVGPNYMLKVPMAHGNPQKTTDVDYARVEKKSPKNQSRDQTVKGADAQLDSNFMETGDYMELIKTPEGFSGAASGNEYQKLLHLRDSPRTSDPDYDYTSSHENDYQPLLLASMKGLSNSRNSIYQALFSSPDEQK